MRTLWVATFGVLLSVTSVSAQTIGMITTHETDVPVRLTGVGLVVGLDGTGDRSLGGFSRENASPNARFVANLLERFGNSISPQALRANNVAAVVVQAEISAYLRPGVRTDVTVSSMMDARSLRGGQLLMTSLYSDIGDEFFVGTAQGTILMGVDGVTRVTGRRAASGSIPDGGLVEVDMPRPTMDSTTRLILHRPDVSTASRIASAVNNSLGGGVATVIDPGTVALNTGAGGADNVFELFAGIDSLPITTVTTPKIIIDRSDGSVGIVGNIPLRPASVVHAGITVSVGDPQVGPPAGGPTPGLVERPEGADLRDLLAGLHAAGARPEEVASILELLRSAGAITAEIIVR